MTASSPNETSVVLRRTYDAPVERVYRAFVDPAELARWYTPNPDWKPDVRHADVRAGGSLVVAFGPAGEEPYIETCEFLEVVPCVRLVHTMTITHSTMAPSRTVVTIEFTARGSRTEVVVTDCGEAVDLDQKPVGWNQTLANLTAIL